MQRASVVISLMEKGTGEDLRSLLARGVKLYEKAREEDVEEKVLLRSVDCCGRRSIWHWLACMRLGISIGRRCSRRMRRG